MIYSNITVQHEAMTDAVFWESSTAGMTWEWSDWLRTICRCMPGEMDAGRSLTCDGWLENDGDTPWASQKCLELGHIVAIHGLFLDPGADQRLWRFPIHQGTPVLIHNNPTMKVDPPTSDQPALPDESNGNRVGPATCPSRLGENCHANRSEFA